MSLPDDPDFQRGLAARTEVMGEEFVARAFGGMSAFTEPMQHHITRRAWGDVWQRGG